MPRAEQQPIAACQLDGAGSIDIAVSGHRSRSLFGEIARPVDGAIKSEGRVAKDE